MKAIQLIRPNEPLQVTDVPDPGCACDGVVVGVAACGLCRSDHHVWQGGWSWEGIAPALPVVLGHELAGTIVEVGSEVRNFAVGDRVTVPFHLSCGRCTACRQGNSHLCEDGLYPGSNMNGGFAELMHVARADLNCVALPDAISEADAASLGCRYMTAWRAVTAIGRATAGEIAAVHGCGGLGLSIIQIAASLGLHVIAVDTRDEALELAVRAGAHRTLNVRSEDVAATITTDTGGAHLSFDAVGSSSAAVASVRSLRRHGRHVQVGLTSASDAGHVAWPADRIVFGELEILGSLGNPVHNYDELLRLIADDVLKPAELVTRTVTLADAAELIPTLDHAHLNGLVTALIG